MTRDSKKNLDEELNVINSAAAFALCPLDGRYSAIAKKLAPYFSEYALVKNRVKVEIEWLIFLTRNISDPNGYIEQAKNDFNCHDMLKLVYKLFDFDSFKRVKEIECTTNHDVKAVEYFVDERLDSLGYGYLKSFVHFGCTSEDITNPAYAMMIKESLNKVWIPTASSLIDFIAEMAHKYSDIPMLAHTHGQPATPTTVGKELMVYVYRLSNAINSLKSTKITAKFNGATGNYSAISVAYPSIDWKDKSKKFVEGHLHLNFNPLTTQIESHDYICKIADAIRHFNNILLDFDLDMWLYISMEYFKQIPVKNEVGSSTMPHKVNPIRFENSESNIDMSNAVLTALSNKLPKSRMQRDLSDSSSMRNIGLGFGYSLQAIEQTIGGLKKVEINQEKLASDLDGRWEVLAEPIQTMLRKYGITDAYETLKEMTRGKAITKEDIHSFIKSLTLLTDKDRETLLNLTPEAYTGLASKIVADYSFF